MAKKDDPNAAIVLALVNAARREHGPGIGGEPDTGETSDDTPKPLRPREIPRARESADCEPDIVEWCAGLDHSDTSNAYRLMAHFGNDLVVMTQEKSKAATFGVWTGTHWNVATGNSSALALVQNLGDRIGEEVICLSPTETEIKVIEAAKRSREKEEDDRNSNDQRLIEKAEKIEERFKRRCGQRMAWGTASKNAAKLDNMLKCAAPHLMKMPDEFNADHLKAAVRGHTLTFSYGPEKIVNPALERDDAPIDAPETVTEMRSKMVVRKGHNREDYITEIIPADYAKKATCPLWLAFLEEFMPDADKRKLLQVSFGLGLLGVTVQKLFFHYGDGANGKSVALEVICRVLGTSAVTLPAESFTGTAGQSGGASPDLARLHGRRFLRVPELPEGEDLREDLVKKLTGGEKIAVRDLFQGYFDFLPIFTAHMSGNGYPKISGTDNGIWRRMEVILWPVTIDESRQRNFEDVVSDFEPEHSGILNWLIEGALTYLREGLVIPEDVKRETQKYRDAMDPTAAFVARCVRADPKCEVPAAEFYQAYYSWALEAAVVPLKGTRFGLIMGKKFKRDDARTRKYVGIKLVDVPERKAASRPVPDEYPEGYGGDEPA